MKREIKFRAWDMVNGSLLPVEKLTNSWVLLDPPNNDDEGNYSYELDLDDCHLMQYTGLKDKNGVEIYEGDICQIIYGHDDNKKCNYTITFQNGCFGLLKKGFEAHTSFGKYFYDACENGVFDTYIEAGGFCFLIVGNIHQNPELL